MGAGEPHSPPEAQLSKSEAIETKKSGLRAEAHEVSEAQPKKRFFAKRPKGVRRKRVGSDNEHARPCDYWRLEQPGETDQMGPSAPVAPLVDSSPVT